MLEEQSDRVFPSFFMLFYTLNSLVRIFKGILKENDVGKITKWIFSLLYDGKINLNVFPNYYGYIYL